MKKINTLLALVFAGSTIFAQTTWTLDKGHAKLGFSITHLLVSDVDGSFKTFDSKIVTSKEDLSDAKIELTADVASINTDNETRDAHLKGADYFDAVKYPTLTFKSTSLKKIEGKKYKLVGDLTLHGITKSVSFDVVYNGTAIHPYTKKTIAGFKITGTVNRIDFGVATTTPNAVLSELVTINTNVEFEKN